jgi:hypothetical protein
MSLILLFVHLRFLSCADLLEKNTCVVVHAKRGIETALHAASTRNDVLLGENPEEVTSRVLGAAHGTILGDVSESTYRKLVGAATRRAYHREGEFVDGDRLLSASGVL